MLSYQYLSKLSLSIRELEVNRITVSKSKDLVHDMKYVEYYLVNAQKSLCRITYSEFSKKGRWVWEWASL